MIMERNIQKNQQENFLKDVLNNVLVKDLNWKLGV